MVLSLNSSVLLMDDYGLETMANHSASQLARALHKIPRYNWHFNKVKLNPPQFQPDSLEYEEALVVIAGVFAITGIILFIVSSCGLCCAHQRKGLKPGLNIPCHRNAINALSVLAMILFILLIVAINTLRSAVKEANESIDKGAASYQSIQKGSLSFSAVMDSVRDQAGQLNVSDPYKDVKNNLFNEAAFIAENSTAFVDAHFAVDVDISVLDDYIEKWTNYIAYGSIGLSVLVLSPVIGIIIGMIVRKSVMLKMAAWTFAAFIFLALSIGGVELAASVSIADYCIDPNGATEFYLKKWDDDNEREKLIDYYVHCRPGAVFPFEDFFVDTLQGLESADRYVSDLESCNCTNDTAPILSIRNDIDSAGHILAHLVVGTECPGLHAIYTSTVRDTCTSGLTALTMLFVSHMLVGVIFTLTLPFIWRLWPAFQNSAEYKTIQNPTSQASWYDHLERSGRESIQPLTPEQWFQRQSARGNLAAGPGPRTIRQGPIGEQR